MGVAEAIVLVRPEAAGHKLPASAEFGTVVEITCECAPIGGIGEQRTETS